MNKLFSVILSFFCLFHSPIFSQTDSPNPTQNRPERYFVGELGEQWQFPSDHLPRGATISHFHIAFWNILNKDYLSYIEMNTQGLRDSAIMKDNVPCSTELDFPLTIREYKIAIMVLEMLTHATHPRSVIALQETHEDVKNFLTQLLPEKWAIVTPPDQPNSQDIFIYDTHQFEVAAIEAVKYYPDSPKTIFTLTLQEKATGDHYRFVLSHIPGDPQRSAEACRKFAEEALRQYDESKTIVLMGDMNQSANVIEEALKEAALQLEMPFSPYNYLHVKYPSHIDTEMKAAWIDNFFTFAPAAPENFEIIRPNHNPKHVLEGAVPMVKMLKNLENRIGD